MVCISIPPRPWCGEPAAKLCARCALSIVPDRYLCHLRVLTRFVLKYTLTAQPEPSGAHEL